MTARIIYFICDFFRVSLQSGISITNLIRITDLYPVM